MLDKLIEQRRDIIDPINWVEFLLKGEKKTRLYIVKNSDKVGFLLRIKAFFYRAMFISEHDLFYPCWLEEIEYLLKKHSTKEEQREFAFFYGNFVTRLSSFTTKASIIEYC
jgi:hypothetical protein